MRPGIGYEKGKIVRGSSMIQEDREAWCWVLGSSWRESAQVLVSAYSEPPLFSQPEFQFGYQDRWLSVAGLVVEGLACTCTSPVA